MARRTLAAIVGALALAVAGAAGLPGSAHADPVTLLPGVTYERQVVLTAHGPVALNILVGPRPGGLLTLEPVLSNDIVPGAETLTSIQRRLSPVATVAGVAGDYGTTTGVPLGLVLRAGAIQKGPLPSRVSAGIDATGTLRAAKVQLLGTWQGSGPRRSLSLVNGAPTANQLALFTPAWGPTTPAASGTVEVVLRPFPATTPGGELTGTVVSQTFSGGSVIPPDGVVLVARGSSGTFLNAEAKVGQTVKVRLVLKPDWSGFADGIGGGPLLVNAGAAVFRPSDAFAGAELLVRGPRGAVGQRSDGSMVLVTVDGGRPGYSVGMTSFELAQKLAELGAVTAVGLVAGAQTGMAFDGTLLSRPSAAEAPIADALLFVYRGVYVPAPAPVLSPNGDGVNDTIALAYKAVRPSQVTATLVGPDGATRLTDQGSRAAQTFRFSWRGQTAAGAPDLEGTYRWAVTATDDQGAQSSMERVFVLNRTLGSLRATAAARAGAAAPQPVASYTLTRTARITVSILSSLGVPVVTQAVVSPAPGGQTVQWDGRDTNGDAVAAGRYTVRVTAENELGAVSTTTALVVRGA